MRRQDSLHFWIAAAFALCVVVVSTWVLTSTSEAKRQDQELNEFIRQITKLDQRVVDPLMRTEDAGVLRDQLRAEREELDGLLNAIRSRVQISSFIESVDGGAIHEVIARGERLRAFLEEWSSTVESKTTDGRRARFAQFNERIFSVTQATRAMLRGLNSERDAINAAQSARWTVVYLIVLLASVVTVMLALLVRHRRRMIVQLRAAEAAHARDRNMLDLFVQNVDEVLWMLTPDETRLLFVSPSYSALTGRSTQSLYDDPHSWKSMLSPESCAKIAGRDEQNDSESRTDVRSSELTFILDSGDVKHVLLKSQPVFDEEGCIAARYGVAIDITARREMETALRKRDDEIRLIAENVPAVVYSYDWWPDGRRGRHLRYIGPGLEQIVGAESARRLRENFDFICDMTYADDRNEVRRRGFAAIRNRTMSEVEFRLRHDDGTWRWIRAAATPYEFEDGGVRWYGVAQDITRAREIEHQLQESDQQLRMLAENLPGAVYSFDLLADGRRDSGYIGPGLESLIGPNNAARAREDFDAAFELVHPDDIATILAGREETVREGRHVCMTYRMRHDDGSWRWLRCDSAARSVGPDRHRIHGILTDFSAQKAVDNERERASMQLADTNRQLSTLLRAAAEVSAANTIQETLQIIADAVHSAGWDAVIVAHYEPQFELSAIAFAGVADETQRRILAHQSTPEQRRKRFEKVLDRFRIGRSFYIPASEARRLEVSIPAVYAATGPHADGAEFGNNIAYVPMIDDQGQVRGAIWLDEPEGRHDPAGATFEYLEFFGDLGARTIERIHLRERLLAAVDALRRSEQTFRNLADHSPGAIYICRSDDKQGMDFISPVIEKTTGIRAEDLMSDGREFGALVHPDDAELVRTEMLRSIADRIPFRLVYRLRHADGQYRWIEDNGTSVHDETTGELQFLVGFILDISARRRAEGDLQRSRFAIDSAAESMFTINENRIIVDVNDTACQRLGYTRDELIGMSTSQIDPALSVGESPELTIPFERDGRVLFETEHVASDGTTHPVEVSLVHFVFEGQSLRCAFVRDITMRKQYQRDLEERSRTEYLLRRELNHRVRNNLSSLVGLVQITSQSAPDTHAFARTICGRIQAMAAVHLLLEQSQWDSTDIRQMIEALLPRPYAGRIVFGDVDDLNVPRQQTTSLAMVLHELMTNSLKYGALGAEGGAVDVAWLREPVADGNDRVVFHWRERGGPAVETEPTPGTGSNLIRGLIRHLHGEVQMRFPREGAEIDLWFEQVPAETAETSVRPAQDLQVSPAVIIGRSEGNPVRSVASN
jgi:PAS domain S-box-containing protein